MQRLVGPLCLYEIKKNSFLKSLNIVAPSLSNFFDEFIHSLLSQKQWLYFICSFSLKISLYKSVWCCKGTELIVTSSMSSHLCRRIVFFHPAYDTKFDRLSESTIWMSNVFPFRLAGQTWSDLPGYWILMNFFWNNLIPYLN